MIKKLDILAENIAESIAKYLVSINVRPVTITLLRFFLCAPLSIYFFSRGTYIFNIIGLLTYMTLALFDWVDGHMAQLYKLPKETAPLGRLIDHTSDRILMLIVLGSIIYAGNTGEFKFLWLITTIGYYSTLFFLTVSLYEFDRQFGITFEQYPNIMEKMNAFGKKISSYEITQYNILYVHNNSFTRILFTHNFIIVLGVFTNQMLLAFTLLTSMHLLRGVAIFYLQYQVFNPKTKTTPLIKIMRKYHVVCKT